MCAIPWETCLRSFFLNVFFLVFFSGAGAPVAAAATSFAIVDPGRWSLVVGPWLSSSALANDQRRSANDWFYVFAATFFFCATVPLRGPFLVRALVCVRCPRTGKLRR